MEVTSNTYKNQIDSLNNILLREKSKYADLEEELGKSMSQSKLLREELDKLSNDIESKDR